MSSCAPPDLGVVGATGRAGRRILEGAAATAWPVTLLGSRSGWRVERRPDVIIDVSRPEALDDVVSYCRRESLPLVEGTSGLGPQQKTALERLARQVPVVLAANFALGHFLQRAAMLRIARLLRELACEEETRVVERHPTHKRERPSATALHLAEAWTEARGMTVDCVESLRHGLAVSDHAVAWTLPGEELCLEHRVTDRAAAARGALAAARWVVGQPPGVWDMGSVYAGAASSQAVQAAFAPCDSQEEVSV